MEIANKYDNIKVVDANRGIEEIHKDIVKIMEGILSNISEEINEI